MSNVAQSRWIDVDLDQRTAVIAGKDDLYQDDAFANTIAVRMWRAGAEAELGEYTAEGEMERSDGNRVPCEGTVEGGKVTIELNEHCYVCAGQYSLSVRLRKSGTGQVRTVLRIYGTVQESGQGPVVDINESLVDVNAVLALYKEMQQATEDTKQATQAAEAAAETAMAAAKKTPYIGEDGHWWIWDAESEQYVSTGSPSIPALRFEARTGPAGSSVEVEQSGTAEAPVIVLTIPRGDTGAVDGVDYYEGTPSPLGTASPGTANGLARGDHVHQMPTAGDVQAISYGQAQTLTEAEKAQARENIGAGDDYNLPPATADSLGGVMVGQPFAVDENGKITLDGEVYEIVPFIAAASYSKNANMTTQTPFETGAFYFGRVGYMGTCISPVGGNATDGYEVRLSSTAISSLSSAKLNVWGVVIKFTAEGATTGKLAHIALQALDSNGVASSSPTSANIGPVYMIRKVPKEEGA